jgi:hypothetical protein
VTWIQIVLHKSKQGFLEKAIEQKLNFSIRYMNHNTTNIEKSRKIMRPMKFGEVNRQQNRQNVSNRLLSVGRSWDWVYKRSPRQKLYPTCSPDDKQEIGSSMTCHL